MREQDWLSAHIFYHDHLDPLLVELVAPLVGELAVEGLAGRYFFVRYWDGGPHVRLRVLAEPGNCQALQQFIAERCAAFFRERPAVTELLPDEYAAYSIPAARAERMPSYVRYPYPNNSVAFIPYRREHHRYGHGASIEAVERHFTEASGIALRLVTAGMSPSQRASVALSMLLLAWLCIEPDLPGLARPSPAHVATLSQIGGAGGTTDVLGDFEKRYARQRDTLGQLALRLRAMADAADGAGGEGSLIAWAQSVARLRDAVRDSRPAGPVVDTCAHLVCNRLGIGLAEESYLRYLASRAVGTLAQKGAGSAAA